MRRTPLQLKAGIVALGAVVMLHIPPSGAARAELDVCSGGQGNAVEKNSSNDFRYGLTSSAADVRTHTGAVCNSNTSQTNDTYTYVGIADTSGHFANIGYGRWYNSSVRYRIYCSYNDPDGTYHHCGGYYTYGPAVGSYHNYKTLRSAPDCNAMYIDRAFQGYFTNAGWGVVTTWAARAGASAHWVASDIAGSTTVPVKFSDWRLCNNAGVCGGASLPATQSLDSRYFINDFGSASFSQGTK